MIVAQLSDTHIVASGKLFRCRIQGVAVDADRAYVEFDTAIHLARAITALNALMPRPDVVIVTGDLVDHGEPEEYRHFRDLLDRLAMPTRITRGQLSAEREARTARDDPGFRSQPANLRR
jgi:Icc protein